MVQVNNKTIVWTISGADCSGGAGIAADIKTGHSLGVEVCHLITANTVQNSKQLESINPVSIDILAQQAKLLMADKPPRVIKIGLLANVEQVDWLTNLLTLMKNDDAKLRVVFDPVGQASVGGKFSSLTTVQLSPLFKLVDVLTPNLPEAQKIVLDSVIDVETLAKKVTNLGVAQVIIKGGHQTDLPRKTDSETTQESQCMDYCYSALTKQVYQLTAQRIDTSYSHGGGCSFATALASFLAHGYLLRDAFTLTKAFMQAGLKHNEYQQNYYGAFEQTPSFNDLLLNNKLNYKTYFPVVKEKIHDKYRQLPAFKSLGIKRDGSQGLGLYPVVDSIEWLERLMPLGINIIQLRLKNKTEVELRQQIKAAVELSAKYDCRLFINDYWQLAIEYGAYGVHIGQEDLTDADLSAIQSAGLRLGISTHGCYEFLLAQQLCPSYLAVGAIFPTKTKDMTGQIQGVENLQQILELSTNIPVVAIGGITHEKASLVWQTGVDAIAVVTAITEASDYREATQYFQKQLS